MMKILILYGEGEQKEAESWFPQDSEFQQQDIIGFESEKDYLDKVGQYDVILALHSLNKLPPKSVPGVIDKIYKMLRTGGEVWLYTPAFEWCAKQSFIENPSPLLHYQLFGTDKSPNQSVYNLEWLRALALAPGFTPRIATQDQYHLKSNVDGKDLVVQLVQNVFVGWKTDIKPALAEIHEYSDPTTAIS